MNQAYLGKTIKGMEHVYDFILEGYTDYTTPRDYGNGTPINMAEIHTLTLIADNPGISVSEIAKIWNRSLSAASQNIDKLHKKNLIEKRKEFGNNKTIHLYATEEGTTLSNQHKQYDQEKLTQTAELLLQKYSIEQIDNFLQIIDTSLEVIRADRESKK